MTTKGKHLTKVLPVFLPARQRIPRRCGTMIVGLQTFAIKKNLWSLEDTQRGKYICGHKSETDSNTEL
jgi:hypothetical protein